MTVQTNLAQLSAAQTVARKIVAVASGKGGVGKTLLSVTLSQAFARSGLRTLLFDGDLGLANVDVQLGIVPDHDIGMVLAGRVSLAEAVTAYPSGGFDILAGRSGSGKLSAVPARGISELRGDLIALADSYDRVVIDIGAGVEKGLRRLAGIAGRCLIVTTDEPTALTDAYAFIKMMTAQRHPSRIQVIVNMAPTKAEGERTYQVLRKACESFLRLSPPLAGIVRRDKYVRDAIRRQTPLLTRYPSCPAATDVEAMAEKLIRER
ncbi:MAG: cobyrinic acid a,c-diamide synthase [Rhodospirillaceae bacterium]|nr:cobyrinic acid a,c-diamide synthase [Rhodospirillaceae bacterium]